MSEPMTHVTDELELFALDVLPPGDRARVAAHLALCPACRDQARLLDEVAVALPDTLPQTAAPSRLRARILASAGADLAPRRERREGALTSWLTPVRLAIAALAIAVIALGAADAASLRDLAVARAERDQYADVALRVSHGGKSWYMAGRDAWAGSGGTLIAPRAPDAAAFVIFHDLRPVSSGAVYALWLIDENGRWTRAANFTPTGEQPQTVMLDTPVEGFSQCALTVELQREGKRAGPVVMQSRIAQSPSQ